MIDSVVEPELTTRCKNYLTLKNTAWP